MSSPSSNSPSESLSSSISLSNKSSSTASSTTSTSSSSEGAKTSSGDVETLFRDRGIASLIASSGSEESVSRGQNIAIAIVTIGILGALGASVRPIYRDYFAKRAKTLQQQSTNTTASTLSKSTASSTTISTEQQVLLEEKAQHLDKLINRLHELQIRHRTRHPMWYGEVVPATTTVSTSASSSNPTLQ